MATRTTATITFVVLVVMVIVGVVVGVRLLVQPVPGLDDLTENPVDQSTCETRTLRPGATLRAGQVTVDVVNASERSGLADQTRGALERSGFGPGEVANADDEFSRRELRELPVTNVTLLTSDPGSAVVELLAAQFRGPVRTAPYPGTEPATATVLLGPQFRGVRRDGPRSVEVDERTSTCVQIGAGTEPL